MNFHPSKPSFHEPGPDLLTEEIIDYLKRVHNVYLPQRLLEMAGDQPRLQVFDEAIIRAVNRGGRAESLHSGIGSIFTALSAVRLGVKKATVCEPWPYPASIYETLIEKNKMSDRIKVINTPLIDLKPGEDLDELPNLLILDGIDSGLLGSGIGADCQYARKHLLAPDALVIPHGATVYAMPVEMRTDQVCGFDLSLFNRYRWSPGYDRIRLEREHYKPMADPVACFIFDFLKPLLPEEISIQMAASNSGLLNGVAFWFDLYMNDKSLSAPDPSVPTGSIWSQALQYLPCEVPVHTGEAFELRVWHDGKKIGFEPIFQRGKDHGMNLFKPAVPHWHFPMIADGRRNEKYESAINHALKQMKEPRVLDIGTGTGLLAMMASRAGAFSVTACEMIPHIAQTARDILALNVNGYGNRIQLLARSSLDLEVPRDMKQRANVLVSETVDHSLLGEGFLAALKHARQYLLEGDPIIIPSAAIVYAAGFEILSEGVPGYDFTPLDLLRLNHYTGFDLNRVTHRRLTEVFEAFRFDFYSREFESRQKVFQIPVELDGRCNAVAFWYRLFLDKDTYIDTGPNSGTMAWQQAVNFLDQTIPVKRGDQLPIVGYHDLNMLGFGIDHMGCMLEGIQLDSEAHPHWLERLMAEESEFLSYTGKINGRIHRADAPYVDKALDHIVTHGADFGFDPVILSDFVIQLGYQL